MWEKVGDTSAQSKNAPDVFVTCNTLPFDVIPSRMVVVMINASVFWLNAFNHRLSISPARSPWTIVTSKHIDYNRHCRYEFGQNVQTREEHDSMQSRTFGALALRPTGNDQGNFLFFSLSTGRLLNRVHATSLPIPDDAIDRINTIGRHQKANPGQVFTNRSHQLFDDNAFADDDDTDGSSFMPPADDISDSDDLDDDTDDMDGFEVMQMLMPWMLMRMRMILMTIRIMQVFAVTTPMPLLMTHKSSPRSFRKPQEWLK
jgi:hypothetical protein